MITLTDVLKATKGSCPGANPDTKIGELNFTGVSTDTRTIRPGELFIALQGDTFDGHAYVGQAASKGAAAAVVSRPVETPSGLPQILVPDTLKAYQDIASFYEFSAFKGSGHHRFQW